jgi:peptidoglycan/xylan/chitin deacetylase (PgdA/CDA1 family)
MENPLYALNYQNAASITLRANLIYLFRRSLFLGAAVILFAISYVLSNSFPKANTNSDAIKAVITTVVIVFLVGYVAQIGLFLLGVFRQRRNLNLPVEIKLYNDNLVMSYDGVILDVAYRKIKSVKQYSEFIYFSYPRINYFLVADPQKRHEIYNFLKTKCGKGN